MAVGGHREGIDSLPSEEVYPEAHPLLRRVDSSEFETVHWPKLEQSVCLLLNNRPGETAKLSFEELFRTVFKCVCHHFSEEMHLRLTQLVYKYVETITTQLQGNSTEVFLERLHSILSQFSQALAGICAIFNYMNCVYKANKGSESLRTDLLDVFTSAIVTEVNLFERLERASEGPCADTPEMLTLVLAELQALSPDLAQRNPRLFAKYVPNLLPQTTNSPVSDASKDNKPLKEEVCSLRDPTLTQGSKRKHNEISDDEGSPRQMEIS